MTQDDLPDDLIRHCEQAALEAVAADTAGLVRAVLSASGYAEREAECVDLHKTAADWSDRALIAETQNAELVAALEQARPFVRIAVTQKQADASSRWYDKAFAALATIDAVLAAEPASGEDEMTTIENVHKPYREALKAISPEYIQTSPPIRDRPIDLREENERLREALNLAVSRGCDHCAESIRQARAVAAGQPQGDGK